MNTHGPQAGGDPITRLVGVILLEQNDEGAVQRARYVTLETIAPLSDDPIVKLPVAAAVANETLKIYSETDILGHVAVIAPALQKGIACFADHPFVTDVGSVGLMASFELVADKATKQPFDAGLAAGPHLRANALRHGLIVRAIGDRIGFTPPLVIDEAGIGEMFRRFERALSDTTAALKRA